MLSNFLQVLLHPFCLLCFELGTCWFTQLSSEVEGVVTVRIVTHTPHFRGPQVMSLRHRVKEMYDA